MADPSLSSKALSSTESSSSYRSPFSLIGKRALVTGAGRGIGAGIAKALADAGASVVLSARSEDELRARCDEIGAQAKFHVADLTDMDQVRALSELGTFDILVNNAGGNRPESFLEVKEESFDAVFSLNVKSAFFVAQVVARGMVGRSAGKGASIINLSSQMGHVGGANRTVYCASKHAMEGFTKAMALDLAVHKVRVNTICPTYIRTPLTEPFFKDEAFLKDTLSRIPVGEVGEISDVTGAVVFLASDASRLVTGSALKVDGGWTAV